MAATFHGQLTLGQGALTKPGLCIADYTNAAGFYVSTTGISGTKDVLYVGVGGAERLKADSTGITVYALGVTNASTLTTNCRLVTREESNKSIGIMSAPSSNGQVLTGNTNGSLAWATVPTGSGTQDTFAVWGANNSLRGSSLLREVYPPASAEEVEVNANLRVVRAGGYVLTANIDISGLLIYRNVFSGQATIPRLPADTAIGTLYSMSGDGGGKYTWREAFPVGESPGGSSAGKVLKLKNTIAMGSPPKLSDLMWADDAQGAGGGGTVTSVALAAPINLFDVSGSPVIGAGTLTLALDNQDANKVFAGPVSGVASTPTFRRIFPLDLAAGPVNGYVLGTDGSTLSWVPQSPGAGGDLTGGGNSPTFAVWSGGKSLRDSYYLTERNTGSNNIGVVVVGHLWVEHPLVNGYVITPYIKVTEQIVYRTTGGTALSIPQLPHDTSNRMWALNGNGLGAFQWAEFVPGGGSGAGGVTSVGISAPANLFDVSGSPVTAGSGGGTGAGTLTLTLDVQDANKFFAGPVSGASANPTFRRVFPLDLAPQTTANYVLSYVDASTMAWVPQTGGGGGITTKVKFTSAVDGLTASPGTYDTDGTVDLNIAGSPFPTVPSDPVGKVLKLKTDNGGLPPETGKAPLIANMVWEVDERGGSGGGIAYPTTTSPNVADNVGWKILTATKSVAITVVGATYALELATDLQNPGNNKVYGTTAAGVKGWRDFPPTGSGLPNLPATGIWVLRVSGGVGTWYQLHGENVEVIVE